MSRHRRVDFATPWHRASFVRCIDETLPRLLDERLPLAGYHTLWNSDDTVTVHITVADVQTAYTVPTPDLSGLFHYLGEAWVVVPIADQPELDRARVLCVGEQLLEYVSTHLGEAASQLPWNESLLQAFLPLELWTESFLQERAQRLDTTNWLSRCIHLRRLLLNEDPPTSFPAHAGRVCPIETPEGPNCGRVLTIALGATIENGQLLSASDSDSDVLALGPSAAMIPFLEHSDPARTLMGANMMRQWLMPNEPEAALVQSGIEPDDKSFWHGCNLLTAFTSWGGDTVDDGIVISASAAHRLGHGEPLEPGDKLSNRHGSKGVVSTVLPDSDMPQLSDGTPVDLIFSFIGLHTRLNFGQLREAIAGRIARAAGQAFVARPFSAPDESYVQERLRRLNLPTDGQEILHMAKAETRLEQPVTAGWVYWGCTNHLARHKLHVCAAEPEGQILGASEFAALRAVGAYDLIAEQLDIASSAHRDAPVLAERLSWGEVVQAAEATSVFLELQQRLAAAGIRSVLHDGQLTFTFGAPSDTGCTTVIGLAAPVAHPWIPEKELVEIGVVPDVAYQDLEKANAHLTRMQKSGAPAALVQAATTALARCVSEVCDALVTPAHLRLRSRLMFSARTVITPGADLDMRQVGLPEPMAKTMFAPLVRRYLSRVPKSQDLDHDTLLDAVMAEHMVLVNRAPSLTPTALVALRPVRVPGNAMQLHPLVCQWLQADFDGDQVAVFLPLTAAGLKDAEVHLSVEGHLQRDPSLLAELIPRNEAMWGLAWHSLTPAGKEEIDALVGLTVAAPSGYVTRATLIQACQQLHAEKGTQELIAVLTSLLHRGLAVAKTTGASLAPFVSWASVAGHLGDSALDSEAVAEYLASTPCTPADPLAPQILAVKSMARGSFAQLAMLITGGREVTDASRESLTIRHGYSAGLTCTELRAVAANTWRRFGKLHSEWEQWSRTMAARHEREGYTVLLRAMRAERPGIVFARAAAAGETDPLADIDSRLFVGLPVD